MLNMESVCYIWYILFSRTKDMCILSSHCGLQKIIILNFNSVLANSETIMMHSLHKWLGGTIKHLVISTLIFVWTSLAYTNVLFRCLWEPCKILSMVKQSWYFPDLLITSASFIPIIIPSCQRYEHFVSFWKFAMKSFKWRHEKHLGSSSRCIHKYRCKTVAAPVSHKDGVATHSCTVIFIQHALVFMCNRRWHMVINSIKFFFRTDGKEKTL